MKKILCAMLPALIAVAPLAAKNFDIKNFARMIECPVLMGIGLQDPTCPPYTNMSSYNLITTPKELHIYPECGHTVDYNDWNPRRAAFFEKWK